MADVWGSDAETNPLLSASSGPSIKNEAAQACRNTLRFRFGASSLSRSTPRKHWHEAETLLAA